MTVMTSSLMNIKELKKRLGQYPKHRILKTFENIMQVLQEYIYSDKENIANRSYEVGIY